MAEKTASQSQQKSDEGTRPAAPVNPFAMFGAMPFGAMPPGFDPSAFLGMASFWQKAAADNHARLASMMEEAAKMEERSVAEARRAVEEMSRLSLASIDYAREASANFRKLALEASKRMADAQADATKGAAPRA